MGKYIPLDALVADIERRIKTNKECMLGLRNLDYYQGKVDALKDTLSSLDALEVKEVDLEKEISKVLDNGMALQLDWRQCNIEVKPDGLRKFAKHFFELGLSASNPITATDRGMAEEIIINLKRVEQDYCINLTREMEWLRNQVKKGE